jgi:hypothetical protein
MSYVPKYIIKRMFPKDECLQVVTYEGKPWVQIQAINVFSPATVPDHIDLGPVKLPDDAGKYLKISVNGTALPVTPEVLVNDVLIYVGGKKYTFNSIIKENAAAGLTLAVGGKLTILIKKSAFPKAIQDLLAKPGEVTILVEVVIDQPGSIEVKANLVKIGAPFDAAST